MVVFTEKNRPRGDSTIGAEYVGSLTDVSVPPEVKSKIHQLLSGSKNYSDRVAQSALRLVGRVNETERQGDIHPVVKQMLNNVGAPLKGKHDGFEERSSWCAAGYSYSLSQASKGKPPIASASVKELFNQSRKMNHNAVHHGERPVNAGDAIDIAGSHIGTFVAWEKDRKHFWMVESNAQHYNPDGTLARGQYLVRRPAEQIKRGVIDIGLVESTSKGHNPSTDTKAIPTAKLDVKHPSWAAKIQPRQAT